LLVIYTTPEPSIETSLDAARKSKVRAPRQRLWIGIMAEINVLIASAGKLKNNRLQTPLAHPDRFLIPLAAPETGNAPAPVRLGPRQAN
jgi:hypothetical protein